MCIPRYSSFLQCTLKDIHFTQLLNDNRSLIDLAVIFLNYICLMNRINTWPIQLWPSTIGTPGIIFFLFVIPLVVLFTYNVNIAVEY